MMPRKKVFAYLKDHANATTKEIADGCGLDMKAANNALYNLCQKKQVVVTGKNGPHKTWKTLVDEITVRPYDTSNRQPGVTSGSTGTRATRKFEKAMDDLMTAWLEVRSHVVPEAMQEELRELREFKAGIMASIPKRKK